MKASLPAQSLPQCVLNYVSRTPQQEWRAHELRSVGMEAPGVHPLLVEALAQLLDTGTVEQLLRAHRDVVPLSLAQWESELKPAWPLPVWTLVTGLYLWNLVLGAYVTGKSLAEAQAQPLEMLLLTNPFPSGLRQQWRLGWRLLFRRNMVYTAFMSYTLAFVVFTGGILGGLFGLILGADLSYLLGLNMFSWTVGTAIAFGLTGIYFSLKAFLQELGRLPTKKGFWKE